MRTHFERVTSTDEEIELPAACPECGASFTNPDAPVLVVHWLTDESQKATVDPSTGELEYDEASSNTGEVIHSPVDFACGRFPCRWRYSEAKRVEEPAALTPWHFRIGADPDARTASLLALALDPRMRALLAAHDPNALDQIDAALGRRDRELCDGDSVRAVTGSAARYVAFRHAPGRVGLWREVAVGSVPALKAHPGEYRTLAERAGRVLVREAVVSAEHVVHQHPPTACACCGDTAHARCEMWRGEV